MLEKLKRSGLMWKFAGSVLIVLVVATLIVVSLLRISLNSRLESLFGAPASRGYFAADMLEEELKPIVRQDLNSLEVQQTLQQAIDNYYLTAYRLYNIAYLMVQDGTGTVIADTFKDVTPTAIIEKNTVDGKRHCTPWEDSKKRLYYDCAIPLKLSNKNVGAVRAGILQQTQQVELLQKFRAEHTNIFGGAIFLVISLVIVLFTVALTVLFWYVIIRRLALLTDLTEKMSFGELEVEVPVRTHDEIGVLEETLERMRVNLKEAIERLKDRLKRRD